MIKARCRECGAPLYTRIFRKWNNDGTVSGRFSTGVRICHIEAGEVQGMVRGISERIGYPIDRIVVEGERKASRNITVETLGAGHGLLGLVGRTWGGSPVTLNISLDISRCVGFGSSKVLDHKRGERLRLRVDNPFCVPVVVGDIWGMFEGLYLITAKAEWEERDGSIVMTLEKEKDEMIEEYPDRLDLKKVATHKGDVEFNRCPRCKIPVEVTDSIDWDLEGGIVTNRATGRREVTIMVEALNAVIRELTGELGEEVPAMVEDIEKEYVAESMAGSSLPNTERGYTMLLRDIRVMGMGNPTRVSKEGDVLEVRVENPFCEPLMAGRVAGYYKALEQKEPVAKWTPNREGFMEIEISPT